MQKELTAERVMKLNFEGNARDASSAIRSAIAYLHFAAKYGRRDGSEAAHTLDAWITKLATIAEETSREVSEDFVSKRVRSPQDEAVDAFCGR